MNIESSLKDRNEAHQEVKSIESEIKQDIKDKCNELGIDIKKVNLESKGIEFDIIVDKMVDKKQLMELENVLDNLEFSAFTPRMSERYGAVIVVFFD